MALLQEHARSNVELVPIPTIAAWALPACPGTPKPKPVAALPLLQRGPAWKPEQVERLWDSLARGFPVGSFLVCPYSVCEDQANKGFFLQRKQGSNSIPNPGGWDWHLFDGQQRADAIAAGFFDPWANPVDEGSEGPRCTLWVDLDPADGPDERAFVFRLLTRSHPWGYQRQRPAKPLSPSNRLRAMEEFERANKGRRLEAGKLPLEAVPFDANAPVPVALLLKSLKERCPWRALRERMEQIDRKPDAKSGEWGWLEPKQRDRLGALLSASPVPEHMARLEEGLRHLIAEGDEAVRIPALIVPPEQLPDRQCF